MRRKACPNCERLLPISEFPDNLSNIHNEYCRDCYEYPLCNRFIKHFQKIKKYLTTKKASVPWVLQDLLEKRRKQFENWIVYIVGRYSHDYEYKELK